MLLASDLRCVQKHDQRNLAKSGIAPRLYSPGGSTSNRMCHWTPQVHPANGILNPSNGLSRGHECDRQTAPRRNVYRNRRKSLSRKSDSAYKRRPPNPRWPGFAITVSPLLQPCTVNLPLIRSNTEQLSPPGKVAPLISLLSVIFRRIFCGPHMDQSA